MKSIFFSVVSALVQLMAQNPIMDLRSAKHFVKQLPDYYGTYIIQFDRAFPPYWISRMVKAPGEGPFYQSEGLGHILKLKSIEPFMRSVFPIQFPEYVYLPKNMDRLQFFSSKEFYFLRIAPHELNLDKFKDYFQPPKERPPVKIVLEITGPERWDRLTMRNETDVIFLQRLASDSAFRTLVEECDDKKPDSVFRYYGLSSSLADIQKGSISSDRYLRNASLKILFRDHFNASLDDLRDLFEKANAQFLMAISSQLFQHKQIPKNYIILLLNRANSLDNFSAHAVYKGLVDIGVVESWKPFVDALAKLEKWYPGHPFVYANINGMTLPSGQPIDVAADLKEVAQKTKHPALRQDIEKFLEEFAVEIARRNQFRRHS